MGRAFTARYPGVKVNIVRTTAQVAFQRLNQELKAGAPVCDVLSSTDLSHFIDLKARKLLVKYTPTAEPLLDARVRGLDPDGFFHVSSAFLMGLIYNTQKVPAAAAPGSWSDLFDPKWRGLASVAHPGFSGAAGTWAVEMRKLFGDKWFQSLADNKPQVGRSTIDTVTTVTSGERSISGGPMALATSVAAKGNPLAAVAPKEGPVLVVSPTGVIANAPHPNAARLFADWLVASEDAERFAIEEYSIPLRTGAKPLPGVLGLNDLKKVRAPTPQEMLSELPKVIELWKDAFGV
jgi:iron(III) transport system substrate-binding protein